MELFDKIKNPSMRKLFGKKEIEIIQKQLFGISLTPSEQTILSRDIRKKFLVIKELGSCQEDFNLKKGILPIQIVQRVKNRILNSVYKKNIKKMIWFGSFVSGHVTFSSDVDLSVEFDEISLKDSLKFRAFASQENMLDVLVYNHLPKKLKNEVDNGRVIYKR
ncbi:MAG: nucleotidyltransferase domain-containing protein [Nanoarchaeota archaeon]|nr:nucleotidyltransferase domain-containing protein [Nanoarchaeota archaeon]